VSATPFILISGTTEREYVRYGMQIGVDDYLTKPFTISELEGTIQARLRRNHNLKSKYDTKMSVLRRNVIYALPHEMRTSLMGILGYAHMLEEAADSFCHKDIIDFAAEINKSGKRLHHVIENYLVFLQLELIACNGRYKDELRHHLTHAMPVIQAAAEETAARHNRLADLDMRLEQGALRISTENLRKILVELTDNAFKFSDAGTPVKVRFVRKGKKYVLQVRDYGRGMSQEEMDQIGAFMQFDRVIQEQPGVGLGLVISRRLAELHCGDFEVTSYVGQGTLARIEFQPDG
jgi:signal transduction histidine kinase